MKYIFVSGGVISGLGKGVVTHYERFIHENLYRENYITAGQIYQEVIRKERALEYGGDTVDVIPHVTNEIIRRIRLAGEKNNAQIVIVEYGGTVGEYKNGIFFEASRILKLKNPNDVIHVHVTYIPYVANVGELKSKPAQTSVHILNGLGIQPDIIVARSQYPIDAKRSQKLALYCNIDKSRLFSAPDLKTIYQTPLLFHQKNHHLATTCLHLLKLKTGKHSNLTKWQNLVKRANQNWPKTIEIAMVGKYFVTGEYNLIDSYVSVVEAINHACWSLGVTPKLHWIDSEKIEKDGLKVLSNVSGIIVPQGWGSRGTEGKIESIKFARENSVPYLGLCFGMQMAVIEFARNVLKYKDANSEEINPKTTNPVIHIMPGQREYLKKHQYGGTIRLGSWPTKIIKNTKLFEIYADSLSTKNLVYERHRHRYEFNNKYRPAFEKAGLVISAISPDNKLVEAIEIPGHPFFIGTQFHPEYISRPLTPHPIFVNFIASCLRAKT
jgi:CTP synthase